MPTVRLPDGAELFYQEYGGGGDVVVSAQMSFAADSYQEQLSRPPAGYRVFTVTLRGYGRSSHVFADLGTRWYDTWADDVYQFAQALGLGRFIYTGVSHGAGVGWHLALAHPEVLRAFVSVVGAPHDRAGGDTSAARRRTIAAADDPKVLQERPLYAYVPTTDPLRLERRERHARALADRFRTMTREELQINPRKPLPEARTNAELADRLSQVRVPTLLVCAAQDDIIPAEMSLLAARSVPGAKAVFFQDQGHSLAAESPEKVVSEFVHFVQAIVKPNAKGASDR